MNTDVLIVGSGCSGLYCALKLPRDVRITLITKSDLESNDSYLAQGGMCMLKEQSDFDSFFEDTLKAGHYENDRESVGIMINSSPEVVKDLVSYGADFARNDDGSLAYTREGAHSHNRIIFHEDVTGKEITSTLLAQVKKLSNVTLMEYTTMVDIMPSCTLFSERSTAVSGAPVIFKDSTGCSAPAFSLLAQAPPRDKTAARINETAQNLRLLNIFSFISLPPFQTANMRKI